MSLRIRQIEIEDIRLIRRQSWNPGVLTIISGGNGVGKSGFTDGIGQLFAGGHNPDLLRKGAKIGKVAITLENGQTATLTVTKKSTSYVVTDENGEELPAPRSIIEKWASDQAVDPSALLRAKPKDLQQLVMSLLPIEISREEFNQCIPGTVFPQVALSDMNGQPFGPMSLDELNAKRDEIYKVRSTINSDLKIYQGSVSDLTSSLPKEEVGGDYDWGQRVRELAALVSEAELGMAAEVDGVKQDLQSTLKSIEEEYRRKLADAERDAGKAIQAIRANWDPQIRKVVASHAEALEKMRTHDRTEGLRKQLAMATQKRDDAERKADDLTRALEAIDELKREKCKQTSIKGLENREDRLYYGDLPLQSINTAQRLAIFFAICEKQRGPLSFMFMDGGEVFDDDMLNSLYQFAERKGLQILLTKVVGKGPLNLEVLNNPLAKEEEQPVLVSTA